MLTLKVALVHDWLANVGGAEHVLWTFHEIFPDAPIYTLIYDEASSAGKMFADCDVRTTFMQMVPFAIKHYRSMLPLMPMAWEQLDLTGYDLVLSSCHCCCKGIITRPDAIHICYCHTPTRYLWDMYYEYYRSARKIKKFFMPMLINKMRMWDRLAADRVDYFLANSEFTKMRIRKYYHKDAQVIYPCGWNNVPNNVEVPDKPDDYYLVVSRLVSYKHIDIAIEACNKLGKRLVIIGSGEEEARLKQMASPNIEFKGRISNEELYNYYVHAKAFLFPGVEDFGSAPLEAQSGGCPVLALGIGGALETVLAGKTGMFFYEQSPEALSRCISGFEGHNVSYSRDEIRKHAQSFKTENFKEKIRSFCIEHHAQNTYRQF